jgi:hypothetical protein
MMRLHKETELFFEISCNINETYLIRYRPIEKTEKPLTLPPQLCESLNINKFQKIFKNQIPSPEALFAENLKIIFNSGPAVQVFLNYSCKFALVQKSS